MRRNNQDRIEMTDERKQAEGILHQYIDKESMDELSVNVWPDMIDAMEAYVALKVAEATKEMYLNMQYYMEYCQMKGYVTPQEWVEKHKHF